MSRRVFASIAAVVSLVNSVPGLIAPAAVASFYGASLDSQSVLAAQLLAGSYIGFAVINWTTRGCTDLALCRGLDAGNFVAWALSAVIWTYAASSGMTNGLGWLVPGLAVVFTLGWGYFVFADRRMGSRVITAAPPA